jgi:hypothetical protein
MKEMRIEQMLQDCLDGYEAGLTPEECLSAYPEQRCDLEPMLRHALSLRIAYATRPSDEFRSQAREQLMFAAGRDVKLALAREPDPNFLLQERTRFLNIAGANAQEALRDVPPPRLAFWVNARRRLLEAGATTTPAPVRRFGGALRYSLSAAVVAITIGVVAFASLNGGSTPNSADAQLAALEQQVSNIEQRTQEGQPVAAGELEDLAAKTSLITNIIDEQDLERAEKIGGLILRQQEVVAKQASVEEPELAGAQQKLLEAQQKLGGSTGASPTTAAALIGATGVPGVTATDEPPEPTPTPAPLLPREVRVTATSYDTYGLTWQQVTTANVTFLMPASWRLILDPDENGVLTQTGSYLALETGGEDPIIVLITEQGETIAQVSGVALQLRGPGADADTIAAETLADFGEIGLPLHDFVLSISLTDSP